MKRGLPFPEGVLFDYGGTLVEELRWDARAGHDWLMTVAELPAGVTSDLLWDRACRVTREVADRREEHHVETPWLALNRLVHEAFGVRFRLGDAELELGFWRAASETRAIEGAAEALRRLARAGVRLGILSNASFGPAVIRDDLEKLGLAEHLELVTVSAEYAVRKPNPLVFEAVAGRLGATPQRTWFVGNRLDTDVAGAKAAGMTAVWFNPAGNQPGQAATGTLPDLEIAHFRELELPSR
jgi:FMN hydrolase / 5-amino-6-(5-phospho-D-ribitylamino)uracil phosphatase